MGAFLVRTAGMPLNPLGLADCRFPLASFGLLVRNRWDGIGYLGRRHCGLGCGEDACKKVTSWVPPHPWESLPAPSMEPEEAP